jgi:phosphoglycolate phosphatase
MTDPNVGHATFVGVMGREPTSDEMARLVASYVSHVPHEVETSPGYKVLPGVVSCLESLRDAGVLLGLTSGGLEVVAHAKLARADLNRFFSFGGFGSDSPDRTELTKKALERAELICGETLDAANSFSCGDTPRDVEAGHGAGIRVVGVATGEYTVEQLLQAGADAAVKTLREGLPLL